jgi:hypothetical protein
MWRYVDADRDGILGLVRVAVSERYANLLHRLWDWKYDSHPLNREADRVRKAHRAKVLPRLLKDYPEDIRAQWGVSLDDFEALPDDAPYILLIKDGAKIVAMMGSIPQEFIVNGVRHLVASPCDSMVHPDYRGKSLSMRMTLRLGSEHQLVVAWTNSSSRNVNANWRKNSEAQRPSGHPAPSTMRTVAQVKPIDWDYMVQRSTGFGLPQSVIKMMAASANRALNLLATPFAMPGVEVFRLESFDDRIDALWERVSREHQVIGIRDSDHLNWRFNSRPDAAYQCIAAARGKTLLGYLIYRIVEQDDALWGYIVDFLAEGDPKGVFALLLRHAEERMIGERVKSIVCSTAKASFRRVLRQAGFYPAVFGSPTFTIAGVTEPEPHLEAFADLPNWFVTMADGDLDMVH